MIAPDGVFRAGRVVERCGQVGVPHMVLDEDSGVGRVQTGEAHVGADEVWPRGRDIVECELIRDDL